MQQERKADKKHKKYADVPVLLLAMPI